MENNAVDSVYQLPMVNKMDNKTMMPKQRIAWIDNLKAFLILLVVLGHCIQDSGLGDDSLLYRFIYSFHMPLFFAVSGYVSQRDFTPWSAVGRRAVQLLVPYAAWAVVKSIIVGDLGYILTIVMLPDRGLWFLWALFFIVLIIKCCEVVAQWLKISIVVPIVAVDELPERRLFAYSLSDDLEQHHCCGCRNVERLDCADKRNGELFIAQFQGLFRDALLFRPHDDYGRLAQIGVVHQFAAVLGRGNYPKALCLQGLYRVAYRTDTTNGYAV